ncbi:MAG: protocatechuate 3,4-dioxygenase [Pigmentiphaga sp.]
MNPQLEGAQDISGTYLFDLRDSHRNLAINRFFWRFIGAEAREAYRTDPERAMADAGLTEGQKTMVREQDWLELVRSGVNFFVLEKFARVAGKTNLEVYAMMRGESFEDFMKTRQVPDAR